MNTFNMYFLRSILSKPASLRGIRAANHTNNLFLLTAGQYFILWRRSGSLNHVPVDGHLDCFRF